MVCPAGQRHTPAWQVAPEPQAFQQLPQWDWSVVVLAQKPEQLVSPLGHVTPAELQARSADNARQVARATVILDGAM
jgi:hypothetical protein